METPAELRAPKGKTIRNPVNSRLHPIIPRLYIPEWQRDMKNRNLLIKNAEEGGIPHYEHDVNLFLDKREQLSYNVEDRDRVHAKYSLPPRSLLLRPPFHHHSSKYQSTLMQRRDDPNERYGHQFSKNTEDCYETYDKEKTVKLCAI
ncbi:DgyrCDS12193 [Dimorphilus gyrociliatus]|uniref:DgyrCDS12193 n=1 Tax=Dimorphilus gyrociliatus TaxID=2664684 RepID=A0A7I8W5R6_9ANNE|nr:DgyrCDS12193 [Dimorphilus gyrociliatus]